LINAQKYIPVDSTLIPIGIEDVTGTPFDFTSAKSIGNNIGQDNIQLIHGAGYDHCWILNETSENLNFAASLYEPESGRFMEIYTTEPAIQFYTGNFLDGSIIGKNDIKYKVHSGLCLETEHFPDSPNHPEYPGTVLSPGEQYRSTTVTRFSVK
jgi:aldose 1-epimerase